MDYRKFKTELRYKGTRDGWYFNDFHRLSDGLGPTFSLFKIKENDQCIGGFTSAKWTSHEKGEQPSDGTAMLFNLTTQKLFKV